jgi:hypothetical protein
MTRDEFILLLKQFAERPMPSTAGRHIYVWQGALNALTSKAPRGLMTVLDLHELCRTLERTPSTLEAGRKVLAEAISKWLGREFPRDDQQRALAVTGCDLLMRYSVPLSQFVQLASESRLIALVAPADESHKRAKPLPAYVRLQADAILSYCKSHLTDEAIIGE